MVGVAGLQARVDAGLCALVESLGAHQQQASDAVERVVFVAAVTAIRTAAGQCPDMVAAIAASAPSPNAWSLHLDGEIGRLQPENLSVRLLELSPHDLAAAARLVDQAKHDPDRPIPLPDFADQEPAATQSEERAAAVEVRILGPVEISGAAPFRTNKTIELVVYLALHRAGVDADTLLEALWPKQPPRPAHLYTEASRARKALGAAPDGIPFLPDAELGRYRLSEQAALDYEQFSTHLAASRREPAQAEQHLRDALTLVRGVPLSCTATEYAWAYQHALRIAQEIVDAAHQLAQLYLDQRRYDDAYAPPNRASPPTPSPRSSSATSWRPPPRPATPTASMR